MSLFVASREDVNEVRNGTERGIGVKNYTDVKSGDKIEVFDVREWLGRSDASRV